MGGGVCVLVLFVAGLERGGGWAGDFGRRGFGARGFGGGVQGLLSVAQHLAEVGHSLGAVFLDGLFLLMQH